MLELVEFGRRLQEERKRLGMNQEQLGALAQVSRAAQATYEAGKTPPDIVYLDLVVQAGVDGNYVLSGRRSSEAAGDILDWDLAEALFAGIHDFAEQARLVVPPKKQIALLRLLYRQAARDRRVDPENLKAMIRLAA
jgi:transcriptional regulator with XRE-family HTH domain